MVLSKRHHHQRSTSEIPQHFVLIIASFWLAFAYIHSISSPQSSKCINMRWNSGKAFSLSRRLILHHQAATTKPFASRNGAANARRATQQGITASHPSCSLSTINLHKWFYIHARIMPALKFQVETVRRRSWRWEMRSVSWGRKTLLRSDDRSE